MGQNQVVPAVGEDVSHLMGGTAMPAIGEDVSALMQQPMFHTTNDRDSQGNPIIDAVSHVWHAANTPLIPKIAEAAHAIAAHIDTPTLDRSRLAAQIRGFLAGATEGAGDVASAFTSPVGLALTVAGLGSESAIVRDIPALKGLLQLPQVQALQRAVQATGGAGFAVHGANQAVNGETAGQRLMGVAEAAAGAAGVASAVRPRSSVAPVSRLTPEEQASNDFARTSQIPLDAATATGSPVVRGAQKLVAHTLGGARTAEGLRAGQELALTRVAGELGDQTGVAPTHPVEAAEGIRQALEQKIATHRSEQNTAYTQLRSLVESKGGVNVNVTPVKQAFAPIYDSLLRERELVGTLQGGKGRALVALDAIMKGPNDVPFDVADAALGDLKALARTSDLPALRTQGQGLAAKAVTELGAQVDAAAFGAGDQVKFALDAGRAATRAKYATADVLDLLRAEPRELFNQLTRQKDAGLVKLRAIQETVPDQVPHLARALLEDMLAPATERGRFEHTDRLYADWQKLGPDTKKLLFPDAELRGRLDNFFLLAKRINENPNPSGTAHVAAIGAQGAMFWTNPLVALKTQLGAYGLSKLLYTPRGVRAVTKVLSSMPARPTPETLQAAARTAGWAEVVAAAKAIGVGLPVPQAADTQAQGQR
jgi:hypothetical protein